MAAARKKTSTLVESLAGGKYFILVVHRQENIYNREFLASVLAQAAHAARDMRCVFILHEPTEKALKGYGMLDEVLANPDITAVRRQGFTDFIQLLSGCEFIVTDGGSNQQECCYLGIPCLLLRNETESPEGMGENALLLAGDIGAFALFASEYESYRREPLAPEQYPSEIIVDTLEGMCATSRTSP
jgi:UDP-N-acetylglucosamine 2-epimerase (non-hydrolysing)